MIVLDYVFLFSIPCDQSSRVTLVCLFFSFYLSSHRRALTKFLECVNWNRPGELHHLDFHFFHIKILLVFHLIAL